MKSYIAYLPHQMCAWCDRFAAHHQQQRSSFNLCLCPSRFLEAAEASPEPLGGDKDLLMKVVFPNAKRAVSAANLAVRQVSPFPPSIPFPQPRIYSSCSLGIHTAKLLTLSILTVCNAIVANSPPLCQ